MIEEFLYTVFGGLQTGWLSLLGLDASEKAFTYWSPASNLQTAADAAKAILGQGMDVYIGVGVRRERAEGNKRGKSPDVSAIVGLWADIDFGDLHKDQHPRPKDATEATQILAEVAKPPTLIVNSGGGLHAWWLFDKPWVFEDPNDWRIAEANAKRFQDEIGKHWTARGWKLDGTGDLARVLRVPGTKNLKFSDNVRDVALVFWEGPRYKRSDLIDPAYMVHDKPKALPKWSYAEIENAFQAALISPGPFGAEALEQSEVVRLKRLQRPDLRAYVQRAFAGEPIDLLGNRDNAFRDLAGAIAFALEGNSLDLNRYARFIKPCYDATKKAEPPENPVKPLQKALLLYANACAQALAKKAAEKKFIAAIVGEPGAEPVLDEGAPYTDLELVKIAKEMRCEIKKINRRWIIQIGRSYFVYSMGRYTGPLIKESLNHLPAYLSRAPIEWTIVSETAKGDIKVKAKTMTAVVAEYGAHALKITADLSLQKSYFNEDAETFYQAICPLRNLKPRYDDEVDKWLRALGGVEVEKVLDWVATVTMLDRQNCAIYFSGPPGIGKNLFANTLARLWHDGPATQLSSVLGTNFNADLARCPLVLADEQISSPNPKISISAELRSLIGSQQRTFMQKYVQNADLIGALRLVIAGNNDRLLASDDDLGRDDYTALGSRFLHIKATGDAAAYLSQIGGAAKIDQWFKFETVACHALWLRDNRIVAPGARFLVEGSPTDLHQSLVTEGTQNGLVCEWITKFLDNTKMALQSSIKNKIIVGNGELLINTAAIVDGWESYNSKYKVPTSARIGRILANLALGQRRLPIKNNGFLRYHVINMDFIYHWAEKNQIGDREQMEARVDAKLESEEGPHDHD